MNYCIEKKIGKIICILLFLLISICFLSDFVFAEGGSNSDYLTVYTVTRDGVKEEKVELPTIVNTKKKKKVSKIVLAGSSSMYLWKNAGKVFSSYKVINTAEGGSRVTDWFYWYKKYIVKYKPESIIFYCGAIDIGNGNSVSGEQNAKNTIKLIKRIRKKLKNTKIFIVSINHCYRNPDAWKEIDISNKLVRQFCKKKINKNIYYIDILHASLLPNGTPNPKLFLEDKIHPSKEGFDIWNKIIGKYVNKKLKRG